MCGLPVKFETPKEKIFVETQKVSWKAKKNLISVVSGIALSILLILGMVYFIPQFFSPKTPIVQIKAPLEAWIDDEIEVVATVKLDSELPDGSAQELVMKNKSGTKTVATSQSRLGSNLLKFKAPSFKLTSSFYVEVRNSNKELIFKSKATIVKAKIAALPSTCQLPRAKKDFGHVEVLADSGETNELHCGFGAKTLMVFTHNAYSRFELDIFYNSDKFWSDWSSNLQSTFWLEDQEFLYEPYPLVQGYYRTDPAQTRILTNYHGVVVIVVSTFDLERTKVYLQEALENVSAKFVN